MPEFSADDKRAAIAAAVARACADHGEDAVSFAWNSFVAPFLPACAMFIEAQEIVGLARAHELTGEEVRDGLALMAQLKKPNEHAAWLAGEILARRTTNLALLASAIAVPSTKGN